jgi:hypothetical protein
MSPTPIHDDKAAIRDQLDLAGARWRRAPGSDPTQPLVEFAFIRHTDGDTYAVLRSAGAPEGPYQVYTRAEWEAFLGGVSDGDFDAYY